MYYFCSVGGLWSISQSSDLPPLARCETEEGRDSSPAHLQTSDALAVGSSLPSGNLINGGCGLITWLTLLADAILLHIMTSIFIFPICGDSAFQGIKLLFVTERRIFFPVLPFVSGLRCQFFYNSYLLRSKLSIFLSGFWASCLIQEESLAIKSRQYFPNFSKYFFYLIGDFHTQNSLLVTSPSELTPS